MTLAQAAAAKGASIPAVKRAKRVLAEGSEELVAAVDGGEVAVGRAAEVLSLPRPGQLAAAKAESKTTQRPKKLTRVPSTEAVCRRLVERHGSPELIAAVGERTVDARRAAMVIHLPPERQLEEARSGKPTADEICARLSASTRKRQAVDLALKAVAHLRRIRFDDPDRGMAFRLLKNWVVEDEAAHPLDGGEPGP